jgi:hypothetical protein
MHAHCEEDLENVIDVNPRGFPCPCFIARAQKKIEDVHEFLRVPDLPEKKLLTQINESKNKA